MSLLRGLRSWLDERLGWDALIAPLRKKTVPAAPVFLLVFSRRHHPVPVHHPGDHRDPAASLLPTGGERGL